MNKNKQVSVFLIVFSIAALLPACGSKGDLYQDNQQSSQPSENQNEQQASSQPQKKEQ